MKDKRQSAVRAIISERHIETQEDLAKALKEKGFNVTQATVSRDIKEMMLVKISDGDGRYHYVYPHEHNFAVVSGRMERTIKDSIVGLAANSSMVIVRTLPGAANSVALTLDNLKMKEVLGTIAGDDTVFVALADEKSAEVVIKRLREFM